MFRKIAIFFIYAYVTLSFFLPVAFFSNSTASKITTINQEIAYAEEDNTNQNTSDSNEKPALMDRILNISTDAGNEPALLQIWKTMMVFVNAVVVVFLIFIATANVFRFNIDTYAIKKMLPDIIKGIILANFSLWIGRMIIETAGVVLAWLQFGPEWGAKGYSLPAQYYNVIFTGNPGGNIAGENSLLGASLDSIIAGGAVIGIALFSGGGCFALIAAILLMFAPALVFLFLYFVFMIREYILFILLAVSPLAFFSVATPWTKKYFSQWWDIFIKWVFMAVVTFFIMRIALIFGTHMDGLLRIVIMTAFTYFAIKIPMSMGSAFGIMGGWMNFLKQGANVGKNAYGLAWRWGQGGMKSGGAYLLGKKIFPSWGGNEKVGKFFKATNLYGIMDARKKRSDLFNKDIMQSAQEGIPYRRTATYRAMARQIWGEKADNFAKNEDYDTVKSSVTKVTEKIADEARRREFVSELTKETSPDKILALGQNYGVGSIDDVFTAKAGISRMLALKRMTRGRADSLRNEVLRDAAGGAAPLAAAGLNVTLNPPTGSAQTGQNPYIHDLGIQADNVSVNTDQGTMEHFESALSTSEQSEVLADEASGEKAASQLQLVGAGAELDKMDFLHQNDREELIDLIKEEAAATDEETKQSIRARIGELAGKYGAEGEKIRQIAEIMAHSYSAIIGEETKSFLEKQTVPITRATQIIGSIIAHNPEMAGNINSDIINRLQWQAKTEADRVLRTSAYNTDPEAFKNMKSRLIKLFGQDLLGDIAFETSDKIELISQRLNSAIQGLDHLKTAGTLEALNSVRSGGSVDNQELSRRIGQDFSNSFAQKDFTDKLAKAMATNMARGQEIGDSTIDHLAEKMEHLLAQDSYTGKMHAQLSPEDRKAVAREVVKETTQFAHNQVQTPTGQIDPKDFVKLFRNKGFQQAFGRVMGASMRNSMKNLTQKITQGNTQIADTITEAIADTAEQKGTNNTVTTENPMTEIPSADSQQTNQPPQNPPV